MFFIRIFLSQFSQLIENPLQLWTGVRSMKLLIVTEQMTNPHLLTMWILTEYHSFFIQKLIENRRKSEHLQFLPCRDYE